MEHLSILIPLICAVIGIFWWFYVAIKNGAGVSYIAAKIQREDILNELRNNKGL